MDAPDAPSPGDAAPPRLPPDRRCRLEGRLAGDRPGMGELWLARHALTGRRYVLKTVPPSSGPEASARFAAEVEALVRMAGRPPGPFAAAGLRHVVGIHDRFEVDQGPDGAPGRPAYLMDWVEGPSLRGVLDRPDLRVAAFAGGWRRAAACYRQLWAGLAALHEAGLLHGDIKPQNIMWGGVPDAEGAAPPQWRIVDLGVCAALAAAEGVPAADGRTLPAARDAEATRGGPSGGSWPYLAPEALRGGAPELTLAADVYAAGVVGCEIFAGERPQGSWQWPEGRQAPYPGLPDALKRWLDRCRRPWPEQRPPDAMAALREYDAVVEGAGAGAGAGAGDEGQGEREKGKGETRRPSVGAETFRPGACSGAKDGADRAGEEGQGEEKTAGLSAGADIFRPTIKPSATTGGRLPPLIDFPAVPPAPRPLPLAPAVAALALAFAAAVAWWALRPSGWGLSGARWPDASAEMLLPESWPDGNGAADDGPPWLVSVSGRLEALPAADGPLSLRAYLDAGLATLDTRDMALAPAGAAGAGPPLPFRLVLEAPPTSGVRPPPAPRGEPVPEWRVRLSLRAGERELDSRLLPVTASPRPPGPAFALDGAVTARAISHWYQWNPRVAVGGAVRNLGQEAGAARVSATIRPSEGASEDATAPDLALGPGERKDFTLEIATPSVKGKALPIGVTLRLRDATLPDGEGEEREMEVGENRDR